MQRKNRLERIDRAADMLCLAFKNEKESEIFLHIQLPFRFTIGNSIILSQTDMYLNEGEYIKNIEYGESDFDRISKEYNANILPLEVLSYEVSTFGDITIFFENELVFNCFVDDSSDYEKWRIIDCGEKKHMVYYKDCIEYE